MDLGEYNACRKIRECFSCFQSEDSIAEWQVNNAVTLSRNKGEVEIKPCERMEAVCDNTDEDEFFYMYETVFRELGVRLPFTDFECDVLRNWNCAPVQLGPNAWAFVRAYEIICNVLGMNPSLGVFFSFHEAKVRDRGSWLYIGSQNRKGFLSPYASNYKAYKGKFFRVKAGVQMSNLISHKEGNRLFPVSWQKELFLISKFQREALTDEELADFTFLNKLETECCKRIIENESNPEALWDVVSEMAAMTNAQIRALLKEKKGIKQEVAAEEKEVGEGMKSSGPGIVGRKRTGDELKQTTLNFGKKNTTRQDAKGKKEVIQGGEDDDVIEVSEGKGADRWYIHMKSMEFEVCEILALSDHQQVELEEVKKKSKELELKAKRCTGHEGEIARLKKVNKDIDEKLMKLAKEKDEAILNEDLQRGIASSLQTEIDVKNKEIADLQREVANRYDDGFEFALSHVKVLQPEIDLSEISILKVIKDGKLVEAIDEIPVQVGEDQKDIEVSNTQEVVIEGNEEEKADKEKVAE